MWWWDAPGPRECCSGYSCTLAVADGERSRPEQHKGYSMWGGGSTGHTELFCGAAVLRFQTEESHQQKLFSSNCLLEMEQECGEPRRRVEGK